jgi:hypothetical protein
VSFQCRDELNGVVLIKTFSVAESQFEGIVANETHVKAAHILTLRAAINTVRNYFNMPQYLWEREIVPRKTQVRDWMFHVLELRSAAQGVIDKINAFDGSNKLPPKPWVDVGTGRPRADVMNQLYQIILSL